MVHNKNENHKHTNRDAEISKKNFKTTILNVLKYLEEKVNKIHEKMKDVNR